MKLIGAVSVLFLYWSIINLSVTGRWAFLALAMWTLPCIGAAYFAPAGTELNGLVMLICLVAMLTDAIALSGVKMWNVNARRTKRYVLVIFYILSFVFLYYCSVESQRLGYIPNFQGIGGDNSARKIVGFVFCLLLNVPATSLMLYVVDRFFSNKKDFVIIRCETFISGTLGQFDEKILRNRYICGINNGKEYYFAITNKAYVLLNNISTCRLKLKKGALGGLYVTEYPADVDAELAKKVDGWLMKKGISASAVFWAIFLIIILA